MLYKYYYSINDLHMEKGYEPFVRLAVIGATLSAILIYKTIDKLIRR